MNIYQLRAFVNLTRNLHYQRTAEEMGISQPSLSRTIRNLEEELGVPLFEKQGRGIVLSKYGTVFAAHITPAIRELDLGLQRLQEMADPGRTSVQISVNYFLSTRFLPSLTSSYLQQKEREKFYFQFSQGNTPHILEELRRGESEIGFCSYMADQPDIRFRPIVRCPFCVVVPPNHALAQKSSATLAEAAQYPMIFSTDKTHYVDELFRAQGLTPRVVSRMGEDHAIANLVAYNFGISVLPYEEQLTACGVKLIPLTDESAYRIFYIATCRNHVLSASARDFYDYALEQAGEIN